MSRHDPSVSLRHMRDHAHELLTLMHGRSRADLDDDRMLALAVTRLLELETRFDVHALLKAHHVPLRYTTADLNDDLDAQRAIGILPVR